MKKVKWMEWNEETFKKAKDEDKPVLLSIGAVWCHWCHVMDKECYSDPKIIDIINNDFIPVRVDNDKRPDINERYNLGGWPTTAFLTPSGDFIAGGTYIPPDQFIEYLDQVTVFYEHNRADIHSQIAQKTKKGAGEESISKKEDEALDDSLLQQGVNFIAKRYDPVHGGFSPEPKFPQIAALTLTLHLFYYLHEEKLKEIVVKTLDSMGGGGMYDHEAGGFFRYSTTKDWTIPHFEKMSEDNAGFIRLYLEAYKVLGEAKYREKALDVLRYIDSTLSDRENGGFYGSQDADEEYYQLKLEERKKLKAPFIDTTIYTNWNSMMVSNYLFAYQVLGEEKYLDFALKTLDFINRNLYEPGKGVFHYFDGEAKVHGLLGDQVYLLKALVDAYQVTGNRFYLVWAEDIAGFIEENLLETEGWGFYDRKDVEEIGHLKDKTRPFGINADAASAFIDLYHITGNERYRAHAEKTLKSFVSIYTQFDIMASSYLLAVEKQIRPPLEMVVVGSKRDEKTCKLLQAGNRFYYPKKLVYLLDPEEDIDFIKKKGYDLNQTPLLYPCVNHACFEPISEPEDVEKAVTGIIKEPVEKAG
jgi:uncharacterized protein